ncbi:MAG: SDR family oxidoreductase, partial [Myxococcota bacterium]
SNERLEGLVPCAGLMGLPDRAGSLLVSLNFFGSVDLFNGLREALARGAAPAAVGISSNSTTISPAISSELVEACLEGDEERARRLGDEVGSIMVYPAAKMALAHWIRRNAPDPGWIGAGINLNAIAPGMIETAMVAEGRADPVMAPHLENFQIPVGRSGQPEEIAELLAFLLGPNGRFFVGSILFCDGGTDAQTRPNDWPSVLPT